MVLDVFNNDAFTLVSMTKAINKLPYVPSKMGELGLFTREALTTPRVDIEEMGGKLGLVPTQARGTMPNVMPGEDRRIRTFRVPYIPINDAVMADDVSGIRAFGSEDQLQPIASLVNTKLGKMKQWLDVTLEYHRIGAVKGVILDANGSTVVYDFFDEFGLTQTEVEWDMNTVDPKQKCLDVIREIEDALGATPYTDIYCICGNEFFDAFIKLEGVTKVWEVSQNGAPYATQQANTKTQMRVFEFGDIKFMNYRGKVGSVNFIETDEAHFFPVGAPDLFMEFNAPAPFMDTVNTLGQPFYAKQERLQWDTGVQLHAQTNTLYMCTRPACLIKGTMVPVEAEE